MKFKIYLFLCSMMMLVSSNCTLAQEKESNGLYIVFHAMKGQVLQEQDIDYFDWTNKEIKLRRDTCIGCLYKDVFTMYNLTTDVDLEKPHFTLFIDSVKIFEGYFPAMNAKMPVAPIIFIDSNKETDLEIVYNGVIKFWQYKSIGEINTAYDSLINYYQHHKKATDRIDWERNYKHIKKNEIRRLEILNDKRLYDYLRSKNLLKE
jgi:hypothetical protein